MTNYVEHTVLDKINERLHEKCKFVDPDNDQPYVQIGTCFQVSYKTGKFSKVIKVNSFPTLDTYEECPTNEVDFHIELTHQCDEWIIGGRNEVENLIHDINIALEIVDELKEGHGSRT